MTLAPPRPPSVLPRLVLAAGAGIAALLMPLLWVVPVGLGALLGLVGSDDRASRRSVLWLVVVLAAVTVAVTPVWLHLLADVALDQAYATAGALALRLSVLLLIGAALSVSLPPASWLAATRRLPRLGLALTLTFRQVPEIAAERERVVRAQRARGLVRSGWTIRPRLVLVPLVVRTLERAERTGAALTLAGWGGRVADPVVRQAWRPVDLLWTLLGMGLAAAPFIINFP